MQFHPDPPPLEQPPPRERPLWGRLLLLCAAVTALATRSPWLRVKFERLFGEHSGPPAWQTTAGFTCLCTSLMVAMMMLVESGTPASRQAVRPGSLLLVGIALLTLVFAGLQGPGTIRGVTAEWNGWFYTACISLPVLSFVCLQRWAATRSGSQLPG